MTWEYLLMTVGYLVMFILVMLIVSAVLSTVVESITKSRIKVMEREHDLALEEMEARFQFVKIMHEESGHKDGPAY